MIALVAALLALPLQVLGYATTCTQGADGSALTGSLLSAPLLTIALLFLVYGLFRQPHRPALAQTTAVVLVLMLTLTFGIWSSTIRFNTPCGETFQDYGLSAGGFGLIVSAYLILPVLNLAMCLGIIVRARSLR